ncbi:MAG: MazG family protein [Thermomicrobiales bacterium]|nr:MAG: MazG family protein [Thermomicrobiales bacterium]
MAGHVTIVGLGPGDAAQRTIAVQQALDAATRIVLRTGIHPQIEDLLRDARVSTCDDLYAQSGSFDEVYERIAARVVELARGSDIVYAVPGHPLWGERTVQRILEACDEEGIRVTVLPGLSFLDMVATALQADPIRDEVQLLDGPALASWMSEEPFNGGLLDLSLIRPCLIAQVYSRAVASVVKLALMRVYPDDHEIAVINAAGVPDEQRIVRCPLHELDHQEVNHLTSVWVPPLTPLAASRSPATLHRLTGLLRSPDGCPWDRKQTHASLISAVIEEAYEVVDAIEEGDADHLAEELGDLLLQVALHAQIAEEAGTFTIEDVYDHVNRKLVRRHPHVFGTAVAETAEQVRATWHEIKAEERQQSGRLVREQDAFDRLPRSMPVLTRLSRVLSPRTAPPATSDEERERIAEYLLGAVQAAIHAGLDPEQILEEAYRRRRRAESLP